MTFAAATAPLSMTVKGLRVTIVNFSEGEDLTTSSGGPGVFGWEIARAADLVRHCKAKGGVVIAIEITMGAAIAGPFAIDARVLETMITRVLRPVGASPVSVH